MKTGVKNFSRSRVRNKPSFSKSKDKNIIRFCLASKSSIVLKIGKRPDAESTHVKTRVI
jgi:hypothetical protein